MLRGFLLFSNVLLISAASKATHIFSDPSLADWLVSAPVERTRVEESGNTIILKNGLVTREFTTFPNFATTNILSVESGSSLLRAMDPEAELFICGKIRTVGGLNSSSVRGYFNRTDLQLTEYENSLKYVSHTIRNISSDISYTPRRGVPGTVSWPPQGLDLAVTYQVDCQTEYGVGGNDIGVAATADDGVGGPAIGGAATADDDVGAGCCCGLSVVVHHELYDGLPLMAKWIQVENQGGEVCEVGVRTVERIQLEWEWSTAGRNWLMVQTDEPHGNEIVWEEEGTVAGAKQPYYTARYSSNFSQLLSPGGQFNTFRVIMLLTPTDSLERRGLAQRRMMRTLAPWIQENPIFFHMTNSSSSAVREVLDQMAEVGFEMMIYSFGSGFDLESLDSGYIQQVAADIQYANSLGIEVGGYDLIALTRKVKQDWIAVNNLQYPSACMASEWFDFLLNRTLAFTQATGLSMLETDGPYGGYTCSNRSHKYHTGEEDSVFQQNRLQSQYYRILREKGIFVNQPDTYYLQGGNKGGMGYSEDQFSLGRWEDLSLSRQTVYDNTFTKPSTMGWMFMPLVQYHAGGEEAEFEPLQTHLNAYSWGLEQYLGGGVAACYRGYRLYDSEETKAMVKSKVAWYNKHREVLSSDIIHVSRPSMQGLDAWLHVNPTGADKGLLMVFNPTNEVMARELVVPLYYTGLIKTARVAEQDGSEVEYILSRDYKVTLEIQLQPQSTTWFLIR